MNALAITLFAATLGGAPADTAVRALTLAEVTALAETHAPAVIHAVGQMRTSSAAVRSAYGAFLPSVTLAAGSTRSSGAADPWTNSVSLSADVGLFQGGARWFDLQKARAQADAANVNTVEQRAQAGLAAKQYFFDVLAARESEDAAQAQQTLAEEQLKLSIVRLRAQAVTRSDSLRSEILRDNAQLALTSAHTARLQAEAALTRAVASPVPVTAAEDDSSDAAVITLSDDALRALALAGPLVQQAAAQQRAAKAAVRTSLADLLPAVTLGYARAASDPAAGLALPAADARTTDTWRLSASLPIFDGFQRAGKITSAHADLDDADAALRDARLAALETLTQALGAYRAAADRIATQTASVNAAQEDLREHRQQYQVGTTTILDVLTSEAALVQARHDLIAARYDRRIAKAQLEALLGRSL